MLTRRCKACRHSVHEPLPQLDKKVIYLDQFAFSELFKVKSGTRRTSAPSQEFWERTQNALEQAVLLQQVVCPTSNIHFQETMVFNRSTELRQACELIGGDVSFLDTHEIEAKQFCAFADAFKQGLGVPQLSFDIDEILEDERNAWLPDMHITTNMDFSVFADEVRRHRESGSDAFTDLVREWRKSKPNFKRQLQIELKGWGATLARTYAEVNERRINAMNSGDIDGTMSAATHRVNILMRRLMSKFDVDRCDSSPRDCQQFVDFMRWEGLEELPSHRISAYLFAALARRYANGQSKLPTPGALNDFEAIAAYGPYVDAMFLDRECAALLAEEPLKSDLPIKGRIFSMATGNEFLEFLESLSGCATISVKSVASEVYGVIPNEIDVS